MYYSLYKFGRHWKFTVKKAKALSKKERLALQQQTEVSPAEPAERISIEQARGWIRSAEPSIEQIEQRADAETH